MENSAWKAKHRSYTQADWIHKPSLFAQQVIEYFPSSGKILELGAGQGQDSRYFAERGYQVTSTDLAEAALTLSQSKIPPAVAANITVQKVDIAKRLPFNDNAFDVVYAHLALHYFSDAATQRIFHELFRVLKKGGILAFLVNAVSDPEYGTGTQLEPDYFQIEDFTKRFFSLASADHYTSNFKTVLLDNNGRSHKDDLKGVSGLIRYVGIKPDAAV